MSAPAPPIQTRPLHDEGVELAPELLARIAADLRPLRPGPVLSRLSRRTEASVAASRGFLTVRREAHSFESPSPGVRRQLLRAHAAVRVELMALDAGALLPWSGQPQELLLLGGALGDPAGRTWAGHDHLLRTDAAQVLRAGPAGARLYLRTLVDARALPPDEAAWWAGEDDRHAKDWWTLSPGVEVKNLRGREDVLSMLVRMQPGAVLGDHGHRLEEDCLMLGGEIFLGDILLRADDYHLAPVGARHVNGYSEVGGLLFVHGALPD
jgi:hypothetical protein